MRTAVIIPAYNGLDYLKSNLPAVFRLKVAEVVIVDDASTDGTRDFISLRYPRVHLITNTANRGFTRTVNIGIRSTTADVVILINQDVSPHPGLLGHTLIHFRRNPKLFAVSFNEGRFGWAKVTFTDGFLEYKSRITNGVHTSFWASGGSCAVRKSIWDSLGGFDPVFSPGYHEDLDIGWRARKRGYEILWVPRARVDHARETAFRNAYSTRALLRLKDRNYLICQWKNLDRQNLSAHLAAVFRRCLAHPGFLIPVTRAALRLPSILAYRAQAGPLLSDAELFK